MWATIQQGGFTLSRKFLYTVLFTGLLFGTGNVKMLVQSDIDRIIIVWSHGDDYIGYNLYKKTEGSSFEKINREPIQVLTDCDEIQAILGPPSDAYTEFTSNISPDPCAVASEIRSGSADPNLERKVRFYATVFYRIGVVFGQAYIDSQITTGETVTYGLKGILPGGTETGEFLDTMSVIAGRLPRLESPRNVEVYEGDSKVLLCWDSIPAAVRYVIKRRKQGERIFKRINRSVIVSVVNTDLNGNRIRPRPGFTDAITWIDSLFTYREVLGRHIYGPFNDTTYEYKIIAYDLLGRKAPQRGVVRATPRDRTPPQPVAVNVTESPNGAIVSWTPVHLDVDGHIEYNGIKSYRIYRHENGMDEVMIGEVSAPTGSVSEMTFEDVSEELHPKFGSKVFFYYVMAVDAAGNESDFRYTAAYSARDEYPPEKPERIELSSTVEGIRIEWTRSNSPDVDGYLILRGICGDTVIEGKRVHYPLEYIDFVQPADSVVYIDKSVPPNSPLCYRYAVLAVDNSHNLSDTSEMKCIKPIEKTPPPPPVIVGLKARNMAILIQWISPPIQDLFGFVVERKEEGGTWETISPKLSLPESVSCSDIHPTNISARDTVFSFLDTKVEPKVRYFYRVRGVDVLGNVSEPSEVYSTYTFSFIGPSKPVIRRIRRTSSGINLSWRPAYNPNFIGFIVYRKDSPDGIFRQISPIVKDNTFTDIFVERGTTYYYRIVLILSNGNRSEPSDVRSIRFE